MPTCSGKCVSWDTRGGDRHGEHPRPAQTLITLTKLKLSQGYELDDHVTAGFFMKITTNTQFKPFKVSISSRSDDPIKPRETNIKSRSSQIPHFISSRWSLGPAAARTPAQKIPITPQNAKPCAETETAHFDTSPGIRHAKYLYFHKILITIIC